MEQVTKESMNRGSGTKNTVMIGSNGIRCNNNNNNNNNNT